MSKHFEKKKLIKSKKVFKNWWDQAFKIFTRQEEFFEGIVETKFGCN